MRDLVAANAPSEIYFSVSLQYFFINPPFLTSAWCIALFIAPNASWSRVRAVRACLCLPYCACANLVANNKPAEQKSTTNNNLSVFVISLWVQVWTWNIIDNGYSHQDIRCQQRHGSMYKWAGNGSVSRIFQKSYKIYPKIYQRYFT